MESYVPFNLDILEALRRVGYFVPVAYGPGDTAASPDVPVRWVGRLPGAGTGNDIPVTITRMGG